MFKLTKKLRKKYKNAYLNSLTKKELLAYRAKQAKATSESNRRVRDEILALLGNKCKVCGIDDRRVLQIDHIHGGGTQEFHRKSAAQKRALVFARSERYQILCANHNWIKKEENQEIFLRVGPPGPKAHR